MPDIVVYPYGPNKPVRIRWQSDTMPTDQDIEDIYASFAKGEVGKPAPSAPVNTGRIGDPNTTRIGPEPRSSGTSNDWEHLSSFAGVHGLTVTGKNEKQGHNVNSRHYIGQAIDVRVRDKSPEEIAAFIKAAQAKGIRVVDERTRPNGQAVWTGPHLHLEIGDRNAFFGQQGTPQPQPVPKQAVTNPNIVRDRPAPKGIGFTAADYPASKVPVTKKPNVPNQQVPITNPALKQFGQPNVAQQFQKSIDIKTPEGKANAKKAHKDQPSKLTVPTKGKATVQVQGNASGSFTIPGIGPVRWVQRGPGFVADVPGLGTVMASDPQSLAKKIHQGFVDFKLKAETPAASPNRADVVPNENLVPGNVDRFGASNFITLPSGQKKVKQNLTDRERLDVWNQRIGEMSQSLASGVKHVLPMGMSQDVAELFGIKAPDSVKAINHFLADQVAGVAMMPIDAIGDGLVLGSPEFTPAEKAGAVANITLKLTGSGIGTETVHQITGLIGQGFKRFGTKFMPSFMDLMSANPERAAQAYAKIGLKPAQVEEVVQRTHKRVDLPMYEPKPVRTEIDAKKAELDARRAARKAETEGPLRQGQGIKVNGQQAEVVGTQGDTVTIRYQDGQVREVKKSDLNAKPTPEATTQPVPTEPKPVSEPSATAPKAKEPWVYNTKAGDLKIDTRYDFQAIKREVKGETKRRVFKLGDIITDSEWRKELADVLDTQVTINDKLPQNTRARTGFFEDSKLAESQPAWIEINPARLANEDELAYAVLHEAAHIKRNKLGRTMTNSADATRSEYLTQPWEQSASKYADYLMSKGGDAAENMKTRAEIAKQPTPNTPKPESVTAPKATKEPVQNPKHLEYERDLASWKLNVNTNDSSFSHGQINVATNRSDSHAIIVNTGKGLDFADAPKVATPEKLVEAHEIMHGYFSADPISGHRALNELRKYYGGEEPGYGTFEALIELGRTYGISKDWLAHEHPELYRIAREWLGDNPVASIADANARLVGSSVRERGANGGNVVGRENSGGVLDANGKRNTGNTESPRSPLGVSSDAGKVAKPGPQAGSESGRSGQQISPDLREIKRTNATSPTPNTPKPESVTAPKATKEPLSPLEQEYSTYLDRMDSLAKEHNDVLSKGIQSGDLELRGKLHYPKTQAGESIMLKAKEISSEWESLRLEDSRWRWRLKYGNESNTGSSAGAGAHSDIKTQDVQEPRGNPVGEATGNAGTQPVRAGDQLHSGNQGAREGNRVTNKGGRANMVVPENGSGQRISRVARLGKEEADWVDAVNNASTPIVSRITSRGGKRAEQYVVTDGGKEIARINTSKVSYATRTQLNIGDIVHSDEFAVHRRVNFKQPTPNTPKPVEAPQKPVQAAETGNVKAHDVIRKGWVGDYPTLTSTSRVKGTDGKWYSTREVLPRGVERTDEIQTAWGVKTSDGTTTPFQGRSYKTKEDLESAIAAAFEKKNKEVDNFLATATTEKIASQREYWEQQLFLKNWRKGIDADPPLFAGTEFRLGDKVKIPGDKREYFVSGRESGDMLQITEVGKSGDSGVITANGKSGDPSWKTGENIYVKSATPKSATASSGKTTGPAFDRLNETIKELRSNPDEFYVSLHHDEYLTDSNLVKLAKNGESLAELQKLRDGVVSEIERAKGLKRLTPKSGDTFDYAIHDEKGTVPTPDKSLDGKVAETLTEGWTGKDGRKAQVSRYKYDPAAKPVESKLSTVNSEIEAVKARRDARLKSTTTKGTKQRGSADFTKDDFNDALELAELYVKKAGLTFEQYAKEMVDYFGDGVKPHLKEIWDTHAPVKAVPKVSAPTVEPKTNGEDVTGVAKQVTGRDPMKGASKVEMAERGRQIIEKDINAVANAIDAVEKKGVPMTPDEVSAAGYRLRQIENKQSEIRVAIEKTNDSAELANLNNLQQGLELEVERILKATDYSLNVGFHQYGMAAQIAYKPDFSLAALKSRAKGALLGTVEVVPKHIETKLASYASTIDQLRADLEAARKQIGDLIHKGSYKRGTKESNVKRLRQFFGEDGGAYQPMGSKSSKQRGAIYTLPNEERDAMAAMRSLAKQLADEGAGSLDEIVSGIRKEIGKNIPEETIYRMLSDKYRKYLLESDVQRMDANRYLRDIQRAAEFNLRTPLEKAVEATSDILGATARSFQAGWDISAPFIQGRKGLIANPVGWMKSWESQLKALKTGDAVVNERLAEMERHPLYPRFVAAGGDKLMRRPGGVFHAQEEVFGTNFMRLASDTMSNAGPIGKYNPVNLYLKGLEHSDAAFSAFMNDLTWDTFVKFAKANPGDPAFLRDTVANLGIIYGRGTGPVAEAIGRSKMGNYFYAPRYTLSQMQYAGTPIRVMNPGSYETTAGRMQALKTYGTQAVAYGTLVAIAKLNGWDIETDLRSSDFGTVALPGGRRLDIFGKESQAYRLVANIVAGRINKKNEYEKPGIVTAWKSVGQFGFGKLAPGPRLPSDVLFGSFDPDKGATPFTMAEFGKRYLPLWVQQTLQNGDMATIPMAILGQDVSKDQKAKLTPEQRSKSHPMELPKIKGKPDPLGRPYDPKAQVNDGDVIKEVQRLGIELKWPDTAEGETEAEYKTRAQKQGDAVRDAIRSQMATSLYKNATITEKREMVKSEISATKRTFNKDFNEAEKTRKADERLKQIERELATGRK